MIKLRADVDTFEVLDDVKGYAKDRNRVYCYGREIRGADPKTFQVLSKGPLRGEDANWIYMEGTRREGRDQAFREIGFSDFKRFAVDSTSVYFRSGGWQIIPGADPETFEVLPPINNVPVDHYGRDKDDVYCGTIPLRVEDPERFELIDLPIVRIGMCLKTFVMETPEQAVEQFGQRYADLKFVKHNHHAVGYGVGTDGNSFYDLALRIDERPKFVGAAVAERLGLVEGKDFWLD